MDFKVPQRPILRPTSSIDMVQRVLRWERQKRCYGRKRQGHMAKKYYYNKTLMNFFMKRRQRQEKEKRKRGSNLNIPKIALFKHTLEKKINTFTF
jgi:hypothetical protein